MRPVTVCRRLPSGSSNSLTVACCTGMRSAEMSQPDKRKAGFGQRDLGPRVERLIDADDIAWIERRDRRGIFVRIGAKPLGGCD